MLLKIKNEVIILTFSNKYVQLTQIVRKFKMFKMIKTADSVAEQKKFNIFIDICFINTYKSDVMPCQ